MAARAARPSRSRRATGACGAARSGSRNLLLGSPEQAEDVVHEAFVACAPRWSSLHDAGGPVVDETALDLTAIGG